MNLDERIATSWKDHWNSSGLHVGESFTDFRAGYLTAMRECSGRDLRQGLRESRW